MKTIKQINKYQIMKFLIDDKPVYRLNIENETLADLKTKSINTIKNDAEKDCYLYFTVEDTEPVHDKVFRQITCPYYDVVTGKCGGVKND